MVVFKLFEIYLRGLKGLKFLDRSRILGSAGSKQKVKKTQAFSGFVTSVSSSGE